MKSIAIIFTGCGNMDGSEIHESVFSLLAISEAGYEYKCFAPNIDQYHTINHITKEDMKQNRNVLIESSRIARGEIQDISKLNIDQFQGLVIPGGAGSAKNLTDWAFQGHKSNILKSVKDIIINFVEHSKPIVALCISPVVITKAMQQTKFKPNLTVGTNKENSPFDIDDVKSEMELCNTKVSMKSINQINVDYNLKIITAPCYMMNADIKQVRHNVKMAINEMVNIIEKLKD